MRRLTVFLLLFLVKLSVAQEYTNRPLLPMERSLRWKLEQSAVAEGLHKTSAVLPYSHWHVEEVRSAADTTREVQGVNLGRLVNFRVQPLLNFTTFSMLSQRTRSGHQFIGGVEASASLLDRWVAGITYDGGHMEYPRYMEEIVDSLGVVPGWDYAAPNGKGSRFDRLGFTLGWKPSKHFELFAGRGKHFIGEGYRTLFLSDYAPNYNYGRIDVNVWKLNYTVLYTQMDHTQDYSVRRFFPLESKYSTMHMLTVDATRWWTLGAFEAVVWEQEDSLIERGFDLNYLNPIIFFRPVEFGIGSSDNSLIGFSSTVRPTPTFHLYGQFLLDEFIFSEVTASIRNQFADSAEPTGSWTNKQAFQLGWKWFEPLGLKQGMWLAEFNFVRPYTYGHSAPGQSFTHLNHPLAHPLGANFIEWVTVFNWQPKRWVLNAEVTYARKGFSTDAGYLGEDLLVSNILRAREYDNPMLQGRLVDVANVNMRASRVVVKSWNLRAEAGIHYRFLRTPAEEVHGAVFSIGLRTALWNEDRNL